MRRKLSERERRRIATRRRLRGEDFDSVNGRRAASFTQTKFNSQTGSAAAKRRWEMERQRKLNQLNKEGSK